MSVALLIRESGAVVGEPRKTVTRPAELVRAAAIARRYYLEGRSKSEIAEEFGLSRFKVARILTEAQAEGIVRIRISLPAELDGALSDELAAAYGLRRAIVVGGVENDQVALRPKLGQVVADLISELVLEGDVLGIAWARTLSQMSSQLRALACCTVVQLNGVPSTATQGSVELVREVATVSGGTAYPVYAPLVVSDARTAEMLQAEPGVADAFRRHDDVTTAVVSIGSWDPPCSTVYDAVSDAERDDLRRRGVCGEICAILVDPSGAEVANDLTPRILGISGSQLRAVPEVIAVAGGSLKANAIAAVVRGGYVSTLVTDTAAARQMLQTAADEAWLAGSESW